MCRGAAWVLGLAVRATVAVAVRATAAVAGGLGEATLADVAASGRSSREFVYASWAHGAPRGNLAGWSWSSSSWGGGASCAFPQVSFRMTCCPDGWPWEAFGSLGGLCRKGDGSGHWKCAPGWSSVSGGGCEKSDPSACEELGPTRYAVCGALPANNLDRALAFRTGFFELLLDVSTATLSVAPGEAGLLGPGAGGSLQAAGVLPDSSLVGCAGPADANLALGGYPVRVVRQGRYLAHYWLAGLTCNGAPATMELKVWPDCFELHLAHDSGGSAAFTGEIDGAPASVSAAHYAEIGYCARCSTPSSCTLERVAPASGCCPLGASRCGAGPTEPCAPESGAAAPSVHVQDGAAPSSEAGLTQLAVSRVIHWSWSGVWFYFCAHPSDVPANFPAAGTMMEADFVPAGVELVAQGPAARSSGHDATWCNVGAGHQAYRINVAPTSVNSGNHAGGALDLSPVGVPLAREGQATKIRLPSQAGRSLLVNDPYRVTLRNPQAEAASFRLLFHVDSPRGVTGIAALARNSTDLSPSGMHVQISKNWHSKPEWAGLPYDGTWYSAVLMLELPPQSELAFELVLVYQFFGALHSVSHAQLSLIGWGQNGLWEEVGLGSSGEAICYEPDGQHRRGLVTDTRPFLVCGMGTTSSGQCVGTATATQWAANHGGADFLAAFDQGGSYQYLTGVSTRHIANGPRMTNTTYFGITADGAIKASRSVSTWAVDDFARHLHSFRYDVMSSATYPRLVLYQLGADYYNDIVNASFAFGNGAGLVGTHTGNAPSAQVVLANFTAKSCQGPPPCWFSLMTKAEQEATDHFAHRGLIIRSWQARLGGVDLPLASGFSFSLIGVLNGGVGLELGLPTPGMTLLPGDFVSADLELLVYPNDVTRYYGASQKLAAWLTEAAAASEPWSVVFKEAVAGHLSIDVRQGELERAYPPRIHVGSSGEAAFELPLAAGSSGVLPISISGVSSPVGGQLWQWHADTSAWEALGQNGEFQVDGEEGVGFVFTYSLLLESLQVSGSYSFAFSVEMPMAPTPAPTPAPATTTGTETATGTATETTAVATGSAAATATETTTATTTIQMSSATRPPTATGTTTSTTTQTATARRNASATLDSAAVRTAASAATAAVTSTLLTLTCIAAAAATEKGDGGGGGGG